MKEKQVQHLNSIIAIQQKVIENEDAITKQIEQVQKLKELYERLVETRPVRSNENTTAYLDHEFKTRCTLRDWNGACKELENLQALKENLEANLKECELNPPSDVYLSSSDRQILDWHFANLEFANATPLQNLSLKHWDQDDDYEYVCCVCISILLLISCSFNQFFSVTFDNLDSLETTQQSVMAIHVCRSL